MAFKVGKSSRAKVIEWTITNDCKDPYKPSIMRCRVLNGAGVVVLVHSSYFYPKQNGEIIQFELYMFSTALQETTTYCSCLQVVASYFSIWASFLTCANFGRHGSKTSATARQGSLPSFQAVFPCLSCVTLPVPTCLQTRGQWWKLGGLDQGCEIGRFSAMVKCSYCDKFIRSNSFFLQIQRIWRDPFFQLGLGCSMQASIQSQRRPWHRIKVLGGCFSWSQAG